ncbi:hypothetical protein BCD67_03565 [Oscillatoriales cyanobacterium USR001]|nr:hypothetical protein BCD67_03565 [Oscillatoriales cyanobacterium USR001]
MNEKEYAATYQELAIILKELHLGWTAEQVADVVRTGKIIEERSPKRKTPLLKIEDYTSEEQLQLLTNAVEEAIINIAEMEDEIAYFLRIEAEKSQFIPKIIFADPDEVGKEIEFTSELIAPRNKQAIALKSLFKQLLSPTNSLEDNYPIFEQIRNKLTGAINPKFHTAIEQSDIFDVYLFTILLKAIANEGGDIYYKNVLDGNPNSLVFRKTPGKIHGNIHPYTHAVVEFPNKPPLEVHIGVKVQGRAGVLHECNVLVLYKKEADLCRLLSREPRHSQVIVAIKSQFYTSQLKVEIAGSFIGLASDIRYEGGSYFISNSSSYSVAKLLTTARKKWEHNIVPGATNDVNRLMYSLQTIFKDFKARH